ncbi:MAG: hypothetical protein JHC26_07915 [Thermofilum sp.]|uniref:hypothetical protein n=1 Tax=Thermofilum sp. TaxID=1961369 RepID=UPI00258830F7|nr:hypothetical protein [Thermofilum sp.]MCI4409003.1 hypothetical protein [Thermofilum sp.]
MTTFENAKIGDRVFSHTFGWGVIDEINEDSSYPIMVSFDTDYDSFTMEGVYRKGTPIQCLFWDEVKIEAPKKPIKMKLVNGVEVPDITFKPTSGEHFYHPSLDCMHLHKFAVYNDSVWCKFLSDNKLCYPCDNNGRIAAVLHAKAMLGIKEG